MHKNDLERKIIELELELSNLKSGIITDKDPEQSLEKSTTHTEHKQAGQSLEDKRLRLSLILQATNAGTWEWHIKQSDINKSNSFISSSNLRLKEKVCCFLLKNSLPSKETIIKTNQEKVYAILTNLIKNALKFTYEGSIEFGYVLESDSEPAELEFFVKDTGIGIPQKHKEIIFERFRQGSESDNRNYEGSGLGLSICKSYVEMLNGEI